MTKSKPPPAVLLVGHTEKIDAGSTIRLTGVISGAGDVAREVVAAADNGFLRLQYAGGTIEVNLPSSSSGLASGTLWRDSSGYVRAV